MRFNTGNPVLPDGSSDPRDLFDNAGNLDLALNNQASEFFTDRLGAKRKSWHFYEKFLETAGFEPAVDYAAAISLTRITQTVRYLGDIYAPFPGELPFTTSGTFESAKFFVIQGATKQELSNSTTATLGAAMIGRSTIAVDTLSSLETVPRTMKQDVSIRGVDAVGDGGEGIFYWNAASTAAVQYGIIYQVTGVPTGRWIRRISGPLDIRAGGVEVGGAVVSAARLNSLLTYAAANNIVLYGPKGTYQPNNSITVPDNSRVQWDTDIQAASQTNILDFTNTDDAHWLGSGSITGNNSTNGQNGIVMKNANRNKVMLRFVKNTKNKGVDIAGQSGIAEAARDNHISIMEVSGCNGTTGAGISIFGDNAERNIIYPCYLTNDRIGLTINGGMRNEVFGPKCISNTIAGMMIDGIVTASGDGGKYNTIHGGTFNTNGSTSYGGIYLGNGSSHNKFIGVTCIGNTGAGIRISGGTGFECIRNQFIGVTSQSNTTNGVTLSAAEYTKFETVDVSDNTGRGFSVFLSDFVQVDGGVISGNTTEGFISQSGYTKVSGVDITGNGTGYRVASGGSADSTGNMLCDSHVFGNTTETNITAGLAHFSNCSGNIPLYASAGDATYSYAAGKATEIVFNDPITSSRAVSLSTTGNFVGDKVRVTRTANATGASTVTVGSGPLKSLAVSQWAEVTWDGAAWYLNAFGSL